MTQPNSQFMQMAIDLSLQNIQSGKGGPFGAVIVKNGAIVATGCNRVTSTNDPTAHAEIVAIREACRVLQTFQLKGCELYTSCEPCPMCLGAIYWARVDRIYYGSTKTDAAQIGFDDLFIYEELELPMSDRHLPTIPLMREEALAAFRAWDSQVDQVEY
jgi:guanine deaminase